MTPEVRAALNKLADEMAAAAGWATRLRAIADQAAPQVTTVQRPDGSALRIESHACAWAYAPVVGDAGEEHPLWACQQLWSDGTSCQARSGDPRLMTVSRQAFSQPAPEPLPDCAECGCKHNHHLSGGRCAGDFLACRCKGYVKP